MSRWISLVALLWAPTIAAADPPLPNPKDPVDYIQWANSEYGKGITENAADVYQKAIAAFGLDKELLNLNTPNLREWSSDQRDRLGGYIDRNAKALQRYAQAARVPKCYFLIMPSESGALGDLRFPAHVGPLRDLAKLTNARARLRVLDGNLDGAVEDAVTLLAISQHLQAQPGFHQYRVGLSIGELAYSILLEIPHVMASPVDYDKVMSSLKSADRPPERPTRELEMQLVFVWDYAQRFLRDGDGDGRYESISSGGQESPLEQPQTLDDIVRESREYCTSLNEAFVADYQKSKARLETIDRKVVAHKGKTLLGTIAGTQSGPIANFRRKVTEAQRRFVASRNAYRVVFFLHKYQSEHGHWPNELKEALPDKIARKLHDPFANKPLNYSLKNGQPFLYSVGINGVDDGGKSCRAEDGQPEWGDAGDFVFWPRQD